MLVKKITEFINVDNLSQDGTWDKVRDAVLEFEATLGADNEFEIDFSGVNVTDPWLFDGFMDILKRDNIYLNFINSADIVNQIKITCMLESKNPDKVRNTVIEKPRQKTKYEIRLEQVGSQLVELFQINGNVAKFNVASRFSQIHNNETCDFIKEAMRILVENNKGISTVVIDLEGVSTQESVLREFASIIIEYKKLGIEVALNIVDKDDIQRLTLFLHNEMNKAMTRKDKALILRDYLIKYPNAPGLLIKYKSSKATDTFGRQGKGEVVSCRVAILKSVEVVDKQIMVTVHHYNDKHFYTKAHWASEHDNAVMRQLPYEVVKVPIDEIGLTNEFIGARYHFNEAIQRESKSTRQVIIGLNEEGTNIKIPCTIPERMGYVFDDWGVEYSKELLEKEIEESKNNK